MSPRRHKRVAEWDDERRLGNSLIVTLVAGYAFEPHPDENRAEHVRGFDTIAETMADIRSARPCTCAACQRTASPARRAHEK